MSQVPFAKATENRYSAMSSRPLTPRAYKVERMFLNSPGGNILAGIKIASAVRSLPAPYQIDMVIGRTDICASICALIFAAGHHKVVFPTSKLGVHFSRHDKCQGQCQPGGPCGTWA